MAVGIGAKVIKTDAAAARAGIINLTKTLRRGVGATRHPHK